MTKPEFMRQCHNPDPTAAGVRRVAVTGASGHIGANLVRELLHRGYQVVCLVRKHSPALDGLDVVKNKGDVLDQRSLRRAFHGVEVVYHLAAYISIRPGQKKVLDLVNTEGTRNVIEACQSTGVSMLVHFSSIHALDQGRAAQELHENSKLASAAKGHAADYDVSKANADRLVRDSDLKTRIIYPSAVFGPNDFRHSLLGTAIVKMAQGRLPVLVEGGYNWVDVRDVAWAAVEAAEAEASDERYILSGHYLDLGEVARVIASQRGVAPPGLVCPVWLAKLTTPLLGLWSMISGEEPLYTRYSLSVLTQRKTICHLLATRRLGYQPRPFTSSMRDTLRFYADQGRLANIQAGG